MIGGRYVGRICQLHYQQGLSGETQEKPAFIKMPLQFYKFYKFSNSVVIACQARMIKEAYFRPIISRSSLRNILSTHSQRIIPSVFSYIFFGLASEIHRQPPMSQFLVALQSIGTQPPTASQQDGNGLRLTGLALASPRFPPKHDLTGPERLICEGLRTGESLVL